MSDVAIVGTFDVANFGDLLFPEIARYELERRLGPLAFRRYSYRPMSSPPWVYDVHPVDDLVADVDSLDLLVVGGGHLIRFDKEVAPGYEPVGSVFHHPTGYWLSPTLLAAAAGVPVAWNGLGASADTPAWARDLLSAAMAATDYVSVRDSGSRAEVSSVNPAVDVITVPDPAFGIGSLLADDRSLAVAAQARRALGLSGGYVIVQPSTRLAPAVEAIRRAVADLRRAGRTVLELPISPALGDKPGVLDLEGVVPAAQWPDPIALAALIAGADAVIAHSLHLSIVAVCSGVPVFRLPAPSGTKYEPLDRFAAVHAIEPHRHDLGGRILASARGEPAPDALEQSSQLVRHWDRIADAAASRDSGAKRRQRAVRHLLARMPHVLEEMSGAAAASLSAAATRSDETAAAASAQLERVVAERDALAARLTDMEVGRSALASASAATDSLLQEANRRLADVHDRFEKAQAELAQMQQRATSDRRLLEEELALRDAKLVAASTTARDLAAARKSLERANRDLERLRRSRSVRLALRVSAVVRRVIGTGGRTRAPSGSVPRSVPEDRPDKPPSPEAGLEATPEQERALADALLAELPPSSRRSGPLVSIVVLNRDGAHHLRRLVPALERTTYRSFEVVIVDNGSTDDSVSYLAGARTTFGVKVIENESNRSFAEACNQGVASATGELILFLNNDIEPITPAWLGRLVTILQERHATAVGPRLVYPRRPGLNNAGDHRRPDLTLQHRGIGFVPADGVPSGVNLGGAEDPRSPAASGTREVMALTGACLLLDRAALDAVGGLTEGYVYGSEDVDLCLKLAANGARLVYDGGAALWHHEFGTQNIHGRDWKRENRIRNRQLFVDRWGPQLFRQVFLDRVRGRGRWSEEPLHVAVTLTRNDPAAGWGDYYTAHELGAACESLGWRVSYLERYRDAWYDVDDSVDVIVSLIDGLDLRRLPRRPVTVAWVRNWTHRWIGHPWFEDYDVVLASSATSQRIIEERTAKVASLMPLATNPDRFRPTDPAPDVATDILFVGNYWSQPRGVLETLGGLAPGPEIGVYGKDWDQTVLRRYHRGVLDYERLPEAYSSARLVLDDTAGPTKPYGAVNARVFDALAAGALVVSDNVEGIRELFDEEFPVASDATELQALVDRFLGDWDGAKRLADRYREIVLREHTYAQRARQLQDVLSSWAEAERTGILIGAPTWDRAISWGDYHYARSLQRELERTGRPSRVHILPDWERAPAARDDVVIHLFGLSEYRSRPAQVNVMWNISHPDLVTARACNRYDLVFVASDRFAARIAPAAAVPVRPLHQATDPGRFYPDPTGPAHDVLFVGNSRNVRRKIIDDVLPSTFDVAIYGKHWDAAGVGPEHVKGEYIPNDLLHRYYASAKVVLADHWDDMRREGFLSNRLYDALASGAFVISDDVAGIEEEFDGAVVTYDGADDLHLKIKYYLANETERRERAERGRAVVLEKHTFAHRAVEIVSATLPLLAARPMWVANWAALDAWQRRQVTGSATPGVNARSSEASDQELARAPG